ncbi:MAG: transglycosylase SLT domain-containing protein [Flavobacteriales bacterium]|nr:transglycosylase SLT domain-containing protein [Flavobacteriales bacterium]
MKFKIGKIPTYLLFLSVTVLLAFTTRNSGKANDDQTNNKAFSEKFLKKVKSERDLILEMSDSICHSLNIPAELVREIGQNESGWRCIKSISGGSDYGDLQVIDETFNHWYNFLELEGGKTRENYLIVGIHCLKFYYDKYHSWEKARFAYGRGFWRNRTTWTCLEEEFMGKIDWKKYDKR